MKWIKASDARPKEGWHNGKFGGDECSIDVNNGDIIVVFPNLIIEDNPNLNLLEWLDESASLPSSSVTGESEAIGFATFLEDGNFYKSEERGVRYYHNKEGKFTKPELFQKYKQSKK